MPATESMNGNAGPGIPAFECMHLDTCKRMHVFGCVNKVSGVFFFNFIKKRLNLALRW
jgi:hypothetical protein